MGTDPAFGGVCPQNYRRKLAVLGAAAFGAREFML